MSLTMSERVARGARHLDFVEPGWAARVNQRSLDLSHGCSCVLGQVFGSYGMILERWGWSDYVASEHGFTLHRNDLSASNTRAWGQLAECWLRELGLRLVVLDTSLGEEEKEWEAPAPVDVPQEVDSPDEAPAEQPPVEEPVPA